ncbi:MAG: hypothetical protein ACTSUB_01265 [Candidatus Thorarchaeota archaeon]
MKPKQVYITLMGRSGWAVVNSFHSTIIETDYRPESINILYPLQYRDEVESVVAGLEIIQETYTTPDITTIEVPDWDSVAAGEITKSIVDECKKEGFEVALDITGGRKGLVAGALLALKGRGVEHVFYLAIETTSGVAKPYATIPKRIQKLFDLTTNEEQKEDIVLNPRAGSEDFLLDRDCIMILLNQAFVREETIIIKAPLIGETLLEIDLHEQKMYMKTDRRDYEAKLAKAYRDWDHPSYSDFRRALCYCGVLDYKNGAAFRKFLKRNLIDSDPLGGSRRAALALDSNMFYNGFPSYLERIETELNIGPKEILCVTPHPVVTEVRKNIRDKYGKLRIKSAISYYKREYLDHLLEEFIGQNTLYTRISKMAKAELTKMKKRPYHIVTKEVRLPANKEQVDHTIVDSLENFASERNLRIILASSDKNMYDQGELANDVGASILEFPMEIPKQIDVTDEKIVSLLIGLSLIFGVIEIKKFGFVFGEYRGKQASKYTEEVKIRVRNLDRARILKDRSSICSKLTAIGLVN